MVEKVRACEQRTGNKRKPAGAPMYNRNGVRLYLGISRNTSCRALDSAPHRIYKGIGNCIGSGRGLLSDSLKQRERENSSCAPAVLLY